MNKKLLALYIILAVTKIILGYFVPAPSVFSDEYYYIKMARSFFFNQEFTVHSIVTSKFPPLYPAILSASYFFSSMTTIYFLMKIINAFLLSSIIFPVYWLSKEFLEENKALFITIIASLLAPFLLTSNYIMSENLFYPLIVFEVYFLYRAFKENSLRFFILSGIFLGLSFLTRIIAIAFIPACFISYLILRNADFKKIIYYYISFLIVIFPWLLRNALNFGFNINGIFGIGYAQSIDVVKYNLSQKILFFLNWVLLYSGYIILASGILFGLYFLNGIFAKKEENLRIFHIISLIFIASIVLIAANSTSAGATISEYKANNIGLPEFFNSFLVYRPIGRWIDVILPLIILFGFIQYTRSKTITHKTILITSAIIIISTQLTISSLFPQNNQSLTYVGLIDTALEYFYLGKINIQPEFYWFSFIGSGIILLLSLFLIYKLRHTKIILPIVVSLIVINSIISYGIISWNSNEYWYKGEQMQLGLWLNNYDKKISKVLFDSRDEGKILKTKQDFLYERLTRNQTSTIIGTWLNDDVIIGDPEEIKDVDLIISKHKIKDFKTIYETKKGIYVYEVKHGR